MHFGEPPKWAPGVKFILVDVEASQRDADKAEVVLHGDAAAVAEQLQSTMGPLDSARIQAWRDQLAHKVSSVGERACRMVSRMMGMHIMLWPRPYCFFILSNGHLRDFLSVVA